MTLKRKSYSQFALAPLETITKSKLLTLLRMPQNIGDENCCVGVYIIVNYNYYYISRLSSHIIRTMIMIQDIYNSISMWLLMACA